jgi:hypothetical protein
MAVLASWEEIERVVSIVILRVDKGQFKAVKKLGK